MGRTQSTARGDPVVFVNNVPTDFLTLVKANKLATVAAVAAVVRMIFFINKVLFRFKKLNFYLGYAYSFAGFRLVLAGRLIETSGVYVFHYPWTDGSKGEVSGWEVMD